MNLTEAIKAMELAHTAVRDLDQQTRMAVLLELIDYIAGMDDRHGYELIEEVLPIMHEVGDALGILKGGDNVSEQG